MTTQEKKTILVVDDQPEIRKSISRILRLAGYNYLEAQNGKVALQLSTAENIDLVISDVKMPEMHGIELLHSMKKKTEIPFIMMTGFSEIIETTEAHEIGADGFLQKPFKQADLLELVKSLLNKNSSGEGQGSDQDSKNSVESDPSLGFCSIPIEEFISGKEISYPIYLKLSEAKFVKIAQCGEDMASNKISELKKKGVLSLYLVKEDFKKYISFTDKLSKSILSDPNANLDKKVHILKLSSELILELGFQKYLDQEIINIAKNNIDQSLSILTENIKMLEVLDSLTSHKSKLYAHSMCVTLVSCLVAKSLNWSSSPIYFRIISASMFHDIGKKELPSTILEKSLEQMSAEERLKYESHAQLGADILATLDTLPAEIIQIVAHHHELSDGSGFPMSLGASKIHPLAKIVSVADEFSKYYKGAPGYGTGMSPVEALKAIKDKNESNFSYRKWEAIGFLEKVFYKAA